MKDQIINESNDYLQQSKDVEQDLSIDRLMQEGKIKQVKNK